MQRKIECDWEDETETRDSEVPTESSPSLASMRHCLATLLRPGTTLGSRRPHVQCRLFATPVVRAPLTTVTKVYENVLLNAMAQVHGPDRGSVVLSVRDDGSAGVLEVEVSPAADEAAELGLDIARTLVEGFDGALECERAQGRRTYRVRLPLA